LVVGWRVIETSFLKHLAENLQQSVQGLIVTGDIVAAIETAERLGQSGVVGLYKYSEVGFTELLLRRQADESLSK